MNKKVAVLKAAIELVAKKAGIEKIVEMVNAVWVEKGECYPLPTGEYRRYAHLLADLERMLQQEEVDATFSEGQAVAVAGHKTVCYFVRYLPEVTFTKKSKPRCVVTFGKGGGEMNVFIEDVKVLPESNIQTELVQGDDLEVLVVSFKHVHMFELFKCKDGSYSWKGNIQLPQHIKEELPAFYHNDSELQKMLRFVEGELC